MPTRLASPALLLPLLALSMLLAVLVDGQSSPLGNLHALLTPASDPLGHQLLLELRLPRTLFAAAAGALLALAGSTIQCAFRNPLAEPGLIGLSGGAALGAALALALGLPAWLVHGSAFSAALLTLALAALIARHSREHSALLLAGVAMNALCGSLLTLLISALPDGALRTVTFWLMGSFAALDNNQTQAVLLLTPLLWFGLWRYWPLLNLLQRGEAAAYHAGFPPGQRRGAIALAALATASIVAIAGSIGFIGLLAPHLARLGGASHARRLLIAAPLLGALLAVTADLCARSVLYPVELPVGVITSLIGAPFLLRRLLQSQGGGHA